MKTTIRSQLIGGFGLDRVVHVLAPLRFHVDELVVAEHALSIAIVLVEHELEVLADFCTQLKG